MNDYFEQRCPKCGQMLRIPGNKGGITMVCPSCGKKIHSDFKFGGITRKNDKNIFINIFEMPYRVLTSLIRYFFTRS